MLCQKACTVKNAQAAKTHELNNTFQFLKSEKRVLYCTLSQSENSTSFSCNLDVKYISIYMKEKDRLMVPWLKSRIMHDREKTWKFLCTKSHPLNAVKYGYRALAKHCCAFGITGLL